MKKTALRRYARLIARMGVNVQKGQEILLYASLDQPEFVRILTEECYRAGAGKVSVEWSYMPLAKLHARWQTQTVLSRTEDWEKAKLQHMVDTLPARIYLESDDPDGLRGIRQPKYSKAVQARSLVRKPYRDAIEGRHQWCIAGVPGAAWARKVHPELSPKQAQEKLWQEILAVSRADGEDPEQAWREHNRNLHARCDRLNSLHLRSLHYTAPNGTDLTVGLMDDGIFSAGSDRTDTGVEYNPNIPSEEVFTSPKAGEAEGIVYSTKPLSYMGSLIEDFSVRFENGRAVEVHAATGEDLLKTLIAMDENAALLGECALIPVESPISASGLLFYSTLYDENASCHLALGEGFDECLRGHENLSQEEIRQKGVNDSIIHVDFMIGCAGMDIDGITQSGETVPIFRNGTWAF